jgi:IS5 family transposase
VLHGPCPDGEPQWSCGRGDVTRATGTAEREAGLNLIASYRPEERRITLGADKAYDVAEFIEVLRDRQVTPHIAIDGHVTYAISQIIRKRIEEIFGWTKTIGGMTQVKVRGLAKVQAVFVFAILAYNLIRIPKLLELAT